MSKLSAAFLAGGLAAWLFAYRAERHRKQLLSSAKRLVELSERYPCGAVMDDQQCTLPLGHEGLHANAEVYFGSMGLTKIGNRDWYESDNGDWSGADMDWKPPHMIARERGEHS